MARSEGSFWVYLAPLAATLSLGSFIEASRQKAISRGQTASIAILLAGGLAWCLVLFAFLGLSVAQNAGSWVLGFASALVGLAGWGLLELLEREKTVNDEGKSSRTGK
jgi:hypothetical protein